MAEIDDRLRGKNFSEELRLVLDFMGTTLLEEHPTPAITTPYFILAVLMTRNNKVFNVLNKVASTTSLQAIEGYFLTEIGKEQLLTIRPNKAFKLHKDFVAIIEDADRIKQTLGEEKVTTSHIFLSILKNDKNIEYIFTSAIGIGYKEFLAKTQSQQSANMETGDGSSFQPPIFDNASIIDTGRPNDGVVVLSASNPVDIKRAQELLFPERQVGSKKADGVINAFCVNMNDEAAAGRYDTLVGRKDELKQIYRVLGRRGKNNVLIIGDGGVGKTAIIKGLVQDIVNGNAPEPLKDKIFYSLDVTALIAGTSMRGMLEERLKRLIKELKKDKNNILFIDDMSMIMSSGKSDVDMSAVINQALSENEIQIIGTSTFKTYHSTIETNTTFDRKFQKLNLFPSTIEETVEILKSVKKYYESFHNVIYPDAVVEEIVKLADKYVSERLLPDSAIDIMDEAGSSIRVNAREPKIISDINALIAALKKEKEQAIEDDDLNAVKEINKDINDYYCELIDAEKKYRESLSSKEVELSDIHGIISEKTGIPINKLSTNERKTLININEKVKEIVIGQDEAVDSVCRAIKRNRVGLGATNKPVTFLSLGKTGVGKTLLAKTIAKEVFGDEKYLIRFDMSEYADKTAVNKLIGAGAGYVGYENGGLLTEAIKKNKYAVLLCDEIEKADPEIYNIFLQIMDEGHVTDNFGKKIDCKNLIVMFTSNVGAREAEENSKSFGFNDNSAEEKSKTILSKELKNKFTPEFLNRIDDIIYFNSLTEDNLRNIIKIELDKAGKKIESAGYDFEYTDEVIDYFLDRISPEKEFGARPIIRVIQEDVINPVTDLILESEGENKKVSLKTDENNSLIIEETK